MRKGSAQCLPTGEGEVFSYKTVLDRLRNQISCWNFLFMFHWHSVPSLAPTICLLSSFLRCRFWLQPRWVMGPGLKGLTRLKSGLDPAVASPPPRCFSRVIQVVTRILFLESLFRDSNNGASYLHTLDQRTVQRIVSKSQPLALASGTKSI